MTSSKKLAQTFFQTATPIKFRVINGTQRIRRFIRKPDGRSDRSTSNKSQDNKNLNDMYIKDPGLSIKRPSTQNQDFFASLASSIIKTQDLMERKEQFVDRYQSEKTDRTAPTEWEDIREVKSKILDKSQPSLQKLSNRIFALQASLDIRNHESSILSNECQRLKKILDEQKQRRKKGEDEKKQLLKQYKKKQKYKQYLSKQIQFLQKINYNDKNNQLQSYRQNYLQKQMQKMRKQFYKSQQQRQKQLQNQVQILRQQKFIIQSHLKAFKLTNQCLIKQINNFQDGIQDTIINSQEYRKLRDKYIRFLQQYKLLRNQYWTLKTEKRPKQGCCSSDQSQIFSITTSQVDNDLSELKLPYSNTTILPNQQIINSYSSRYQ